MQEKNDRIAVVVATGIWEIEYDTQQAQKDTVVRFSVPAIGDETYEVDLQLGDSIAVAVAERVIEIIDQGHAVSRDEQQTGVYGFVVPDHLLATFINTFPDRETYRR